MQISKSSYLMNIKHLTRLHKSKPFCAKSHKKTSIIITWRGADEQQNYFGRSFAAILFLLAEKNGLTVWAFLF